MAPKAKKGVSGGQLTKISSKGSVRSGPAIIRALHRVKRQIGQQAGQWLASGLDRLRGFAKLRRSMPRGLRQGKGSGARKVNGALIRWRHYGLRSAGAAPSRRILLRLSGGRRHIIEMAAVLPNGGSLAKRGQGGR